MIRRQSVEKQYEHKLEMTFDSNPYAVILFDPRCDYQYKINDVAQTVTPYIGRLVKLEISFNSIFPLNDIYLDDAALQLLEPITVKLKEIVVESANTLSLPLFLKELIIEVATAKPL